MKNPDINTRLQMVTEDTLAMENRQFRGTGGISANNSELGFEPAFLDTETGNVYRSRFQDGRPAPVHMLAGLPDEVVETNKQSNGHRVIKHSVVSGFIREGSFYSREEVAALKQLH